MAEPAGDDAMFMAAFIRNAPFEAVKALLGRLSPKDILRMRSICKTWRDELCNRELFTRLNRDEPPQPLLCFDRAASADPYVHRLSDYCVESLDLRPGRAPSTVLRFTDNDDYFIDDYHLEGRDEDAPAIENDFLVDYERMENYGEAMFKPPVTVHASLDEAGVAEAAAATRGRIEPRAGAVFGERSALATQHHHHHHHHPPLRADKSPRRSAGEIMAEPAGDDAMFMAAFIRNAPIEAIKALLGRLSPKDILRMRSVCKAWRDELCNRALLTRLNRDEPPQPLLYTHLSDYCVESLDLRSGRPPSTLLRFTDNDYFVDQYLQGRDPDAPAIKDDFPREGEAILKPPVTVHASLEKATSSSAEGAVRSEKPAARSAEEAAPTAKKRGPTMISDADAAAAAALMPFDATGKRKKYKSWQTELRSAIGGYFPEGVPMKISHDSSFLQIAGVINNIRGTAVEVGNLAGEEALRQVLPPGTDFGRGKTAVDCAALKFLSS